MIVGVLVELMNKNVDRIFDYQVPEELTSKVKVGVRVRVPFAKRTLEGFVLEIKETTDFHETLREINEVLDDEVILNEELIALGKWLQKETLATLISCYQVMLPKALKAGSHGTKKYITVYHYIPDNNLSLTASQKEIVACFKDKTTLSSDDLKQFSTSRLTTLVNKGILKKEKVETYRLTYQKEGSSNITLTELQNKAVHDILTDSHSVFLLHGVTGSGKTEVYIRLIEDTIKKGKSCIVLVPEISLTTQIINRFKNRFGDTIAVLHSALSEGEKYDEYRRIAKGLANIVIGARSAIFAPLKNIGLIIMDEEHSDSYKQENMPRYDTKQVALERAKYHHAKVVLGSATPTLESYTRAIKNYYKLVELPSRIKGVSLPEINIVDMNQAIKKATFHFSLELIEKMKEVLSRKEQIMLLLNRRGYSSVIICQNCGFTKKCPRCDITLTYHKKSNLLRCHYCGYATTMNDTCPSCHEKAMKPLGVGTEKIEEELKQLFPDEKVLRMDVDTTSNKGAHEKIINSFAKGEASILLGTQMIAKGLDFPNVTLVGVINADTSLMLPDFRSSEVTFDLLNQVAGRSGRSEKKGSVILQTFNKDHYAIFCAKENNYKKFYMIEMKNRHMMNYPPYCYLVLIHIASKDEEVALKEAKRSYQVLKKYLDKTTFLGPVPANIFKKYNIYRYQMILKYKKQDNLHEVLEKLVKYYASNNKVKIDIDFNPLHLS